jgi:Bacterial TniB protein
MHKENGEFADLSLQEKVRLVEHILVLHPQMQAILDKMDYCREHAKTALESIGMLVTGEKGTGKTTIMDIYLEKNQVRKTRRATYIPVLPIRIPVPASERGLTVTLLTALNDPYPSKGSIVIQTLRVYGLVEKCLVELVMFDEFQHFAERESFKLNRTVSDWTKNFMGETRKPLILFGTPKSAEILDGEENEQLRRRFPYRMKLKKFGWKSKEDQMIFRKFLEIVDRKLPLAESSQLSEPKMSGRIYKATGGLMFEIMRLIRWAAVAALKRDEHKISLDLLKESFEENLATNSPNLKNPFRM